MKIYHGSNVVVEVPKILGRLRALDFGVGFYCTSSKQQATKWAKSVTRRRQEGKAVVNCYEIEEVYLQSDVVLKFDAPTEEWLDFVVANRKDVALQYKNYDVIIGPVANDNTLPVIDDYMDGRYTKSEAIARLLPQKLIDQIVFTTEQSLKALHFIGFEEVEG